MKDDLPIQGPLGIWPFPVLNALVKIAESRNGSDSVKVIRLQEDDDGNIVIRSD